MQADKRSDFAFGFRRTVVEDHNPFVHAFDADERRFDLAQFYAITQVFDLVVCAAQEQIVTIFVYAYQIAGAIERIVIEAIQWILNECLFRSLFVT